MSNSTDNNRQRDAASLRILGAFFSALGGLVLVATIWALDDRRAAIVNFAGGAILVAVGGGMLLAARAMARRQPATSQRSNQSNTSVE